MTIDTGAGVMVGAELKISEGVIYTYQNGAIVTHGPESPEYVDQLEMEVMTLRDQLRNARASLRAERGVTA